MQYKKIIIISALLIAIRSLLVTSPAARASFSDVPASLEQSKSITALEQQGVIKGYPDGTFRPTESIKRAELLKMIFSHIDYNPPAKIHDTQFNDIPSNSWFSGYVQKALELGIIVFEAKVPSFFPDQPIIKIEALKMIMPLEGIPTPFTNDITPLIFKDVRPNAPYAWLVRAAQKAGLYASNKNNRFYPFKNLTRAEAAELLYKAQFYRENSGTIINITLEEDAGLEETFSANELELINNPKFPIFLDVWTKINKKYVNKTSIDQDELVYGAIDGMVKKLNDPYSVFTSPKTSAEIEQRLNGTYEGIGTVIDHFEDDFIILSTITDSPAEKAGLKAGDIIKKVNDKSTAGLSIDTVVQLIKGPAGTQVNLTVNRNGQTLTYTMIRQSLKLDTVIPEQSAITIPSDIGYIGIYQFTEATDEEFETTLEETLAKGIRGIILDLRNNPGGYLDTSYYVLNNIIPVNKPLIHIKIADSIIQEKSAGNGKLSGLPLVVLVNDGTASAAEVVAGAIQDHGLGKLIGEKTFGKGTVQEVNIYTDGSLLKLSIAHWLTPLKRDINGTGLTPDIIITPTKDDALGKTDTQLQRAIVELQKQF